MKPRYIIIWKTHTVPGLHVCGGEAHQNHDKKKKKEKKWSEQSIRTQYENKELVFEPFYGNII